MECFEGEDLEGNWTFRRGVQRAENLMECVWEKFGWSGGFEFVLVNWWSGKSEL